MKRPLAITLLGGLSAVYAVFLAMTTRWGVVSSTPDASGYIEPIPDVSSFADFLRALIVGFLLLRFPRAGVLTIHTLLGSHVVGALLNHIRLSEGLRDTVGLHGVSPADGLFQDLPFDVAVVWALVAVATVPFWQKTPWSSSFSGAANV